MGCSRVGAPRLVAGNSLPTTPPVFLVDQLPSQESAVLDGPEGHHAAAVRRLRPDEQLVLVDGNGGRAYCVVQTADRNTLTLRVLDTAVELPPQPRVVLIQALLKGDRGELAVEMATEAGVDGIVPWRASRSVTQWDSGPRGVKALSRWRSTVREAAKQSRRAWVPEVTEPMTTTQLIELIRASKTTLVLHESAENRLTESTLPDNGEVLLIVGPEGGISDQEVAVFVEAGAVSVRMGPTLLRASTAAAVALGALGALTRRWDDPTIA